MTEMNDKTVVADLVLGDGREIYLNMREITLGEYRSLFDRQQTPEQEDLVLARVAGLTLEEYRTLPLPDWRQLTLRFFEKSREPLAEKN